MRCTAYPGGNQQYPNMRSVQVNLGENPVVHIFTLPVKEMEDQWRVQVNADPETEVENGTIESTVWFDTDEASAYAIRTLLETGKAPGEE